MFTYPLDMFKTSVAAAFCDHMTAPMFFNDVVRRDSLKLKPITAYGYKNKTYGFNQMVTGLNQPLECTQLVNGETETTGKCFSINMDIEPCNLEKNVDSYYSAFNEFGPVRNLVFFGDFWRFWRFSE